MEGIEKSIRGQLVLCGSTKPGYVVVSQNRHGILTSVDLNKWLADCRHSQLKSAVEITVKRVVE